MTADLTKATAHTISELRLRLELDQALSDIKILKKYVKQIQKEIKKCS